MRRGSIVATVLLTLSFIVIASTFLLFSFFLPEEYDRVFDEDGEDNGSDPGSETGGEVRSGDEENVVEGESEDDTYTPIHVETPEAVKAIYMTSCVAGTPSLRGPMVELIEDTELNSLVLDIKDFTGMIAFRAEDDDLEAAYATHCPVTDMREFVRDLNERGIYVIGRITVFQDVYLGEKRPDLAVRTESTGDVWEDNKGIHFTDPGAEEVWEYHMRLTRESYELGFDEINFDYIRYPSDGPVDDIYFPHSDGEIKADVLEEFFIFLEREARDIGVVTSADLFGMTTSTNNDLGIGQIWEKALPYFDYIAPMVYPSHYPYGFKGLGNPNEYPYEVVKWSLEDAIKRTVAATTTVPTQGAERIGTTTPAIYTKDVFEPERIRPWIQDFRYGGPYGAEEIRAQMRAVYDAGLTSWMLWDPANRYTPAALEPAE